MYKWKKTRQLFSDYEPDARFQISVCIFCLEKIWRQDSRFQALINESDGKDSQAAEENRKPDWGIRTYKVIL